MVVRASVIRVAFSVPRENAAGRDSWLLSQKVCARCVDAAPLNMMACVAASFAARRYLSS
jgi:hypothetical protein